MLNVSPGPKHKPINPEYRHATRFQWQHGRRLPDAGHLGTRQLHRPEAAGLYLPFGGGFNTGVIDTASDSGANPGLLDQRFALESAVENIAALGGDPQSTSFHSWKFLEENAANSSATFLKLLPIVDNISVFPKYTHRYLQGATTSRPADFGSNAREGYQVTPFPADPHTTSANVTLADAFTLQAFSCPA
ncbi:hypothetical protein EJ03DRAFT_384741 [Teratosphaeria nubilosa]|uniref:Uncharacterized protein n=1 Tax=Teratosphaeria nubilosa TaxID=161662 RepID=A0A6G1L285_9PEZI|nr:hypothetical protein EJ03DRAFT_384741 [Teratosphaeria nubilosa]